MSMDPDRETTDEAADALEPAEEGVENELGDAGRDKGAPFIDPTGNL